MSIILLLVAILTQGQAAEKRATVDSVIGEAVDINKEDRTVTIKTDKGAIAIAKAADDTICLRIPAGETTLTKAAAIQFGDIRVGDRVMGRGSMSDDRKQLRAERLIVLSKAEIEKKLERDLEEWRRRGLSGIVKELDPQTGEINLEARGMDGLSRVRVTTEKCDFRRYRAESVKFADAKPSSFAELRVGDQLRALGDRSADGKSLRAEAIVSGSFQTVGAVVKEVDLQKNEIKAETLDKKHAVVISIGKDSALHRIPDQLASMIAQRILAGAGGRPPSPPPQNQGGQRPAGPAPDIQQLIDTLPSLTINDIKAGDVIAVTSATEKDVSRRTAIKLVAGVDGVLKALVAPPGKRQVIPLSAGLPAVFDFSVVQ